MFISRPFRKQLHVLSYIVDGRLKAKREGGEANRSERACFTKALLSIVLLSKNQTATQHMSWLPDF